MSSPIPPAQPAKIVALHQEITPPQFLLESKICLIGRSEMCQIVIPNRIVSRIQAVIEPNESGHYILHDSNSANGTLVNGQRIHAPYVLQDQDEIGVGTATTLLRFETPPQTVPNDEAEAVAL